MSKRIVLIILCCMGIHLSGQMMMYYELYTLGWFCFGVFGSVIIIPILLIKQQNGGDTDE